MRNDPVKDCAVYREIGCSHVDGILCDYPNCSIMKQYTNEKAESTDYAGNGTAGREADVKPTGFFFRMSNRESVATEIDLITDAIAAVKYAAEEDQKISHNKHIDKHYRDALACLNIKLTGATVSRVRAQTIGK